MIVLDTNVVSQLVRPHADEAVLRWLDRQAFSSFRLTAISIMEITFGIEAMPESRRKAAHASAWASVFENSFSEKVLPFDAAAAEIAGRISAQRVRRGMIVDTNDTQIAAIAIAHNATIATRNVRHFPDLPVAVVDPWVA
jgi:predicted nucleic acid-binding protein